MQLDESEYGHVDGELVTKFHAAAAQGLEVTVSNYGASIISVRSPDREGRVGEITLGFDELSGYIGPHPYFGATVGRYANRIRNGSFTLDGNEYILARNDGAHHLHGGTLGFNRVLWKATADSGEESATVTFTYVSRDGEEGYPGELEVSVAYVVTDNNRLQIEYRARADQPTPVNLTNHTYWNLNRPGCDVRDHRLKINSNAYLAVDDELLPTGRLLSVESSPYDFRKAKQIRKDFESSRGYDHNFVLAGEPGRVRMAAELLCEETGRMMSVMTDQPALQLYTSNMLEKCTGRDGIEYDRYGALCLETGTLNDSVHHANFPNSILRPPDRYSHTTIHEFHVSQ